MKEMIQKPEVTEEWYRKKALELALKIEEWIPRSMDDVRTAVLEGFIRSLAEEIQSEK